jgi:hypothetical protein
MALITVALSVKFNVVNVKLLVKGFRQIGLPDDLVILIGNWLSTRYFYVSINGSNLYLHLLYFKTLQDFTLGQHILFDLTEITHFEDDNYNVR